MVVPIRIGMIGLSASAKTGWASDAHLPYLQSARGRAKYKITALCNTSVAAAERAIATYGLDPGTKAYGDPEELARDAEIDLVVCNVRVDAHYKTIRPSIRAGKSVYIEWPVTSSVRDTEELAALARDTGARAVVGLQRRRAPPVLKVKELLQSGVVGKLLSTDIRAFGGTIDREILPVGLTYFAQREVGGNPMTIGFAHMFDYVQAVVGEIVPGTLHARSQLQRPDVRVRDPAQENAIVDVMRSNVPDLLSLHGALAGNAAVSEGATLSANFRRGQASFDDPALTWTLVCERGEIRLVGPQGLSLEDEADQARAAIYVQHYGQGAAAERVPWAWEEAQTDVPARARNVMEVYEAFAAGAMDRMASLDSALIRARQIEQLLASFEG